MNKTTKANKGTQLPRITIPAEVLKAKKVNRDKYTLIVALVGEEAQDARNLLLNAGVKACQEYLKSRDVGMMTETIETPWQKEDSTFSFMDGTLLVYGYRGEEVSVSLFRKVA